MRSTLTRLQAEEGHALPLIGLLIGGAGVIVLGIGAANDSDVWTISGAVVAAIGPFIYSFLHHTTIDYELFRRTTEGD